MENKKQLKEAIKREYAKCAQDPTYFLGKYGIIQHPVRGKVNFVFVEFPILSKQSYIAARAALAAKKQNLYNKFHLSLMKIKGRVDEDKVFNIARKIGLDINELKIDMNNPDIEQQLMKNREIAKLLGLNGTPAFIIGDIIYPGALNLNNLKDIIKKYREN